MTSRYVGDPNYLFPADQHTGWVPVIQRISLRPRVEGLPRVVDLKKDVWAIADTLRSVYARNKAGDVILPMTILRRLECVMAPHRAQVAAIIAQQPNETLRVEMIKSFTGGVKVSGRWSSATSATSPQPTSARSPGP